MNPLWRRLGQRKARKRPSVAEQQLALMARRRFAPDEIVPVFSLDSGPSVEPVGGASEGGADG